MGPLLIKPAELLVIYTGADRQPPWTWRISKPRVENGSLPAGAKTLAKTERSPQAQRDLVDIWLLP